MSAHRVIICAAGDAARWGNHLGVPKHLIPHYGEPLLHRAARQVRELAPKADVWVTGPADERYDAPGARLFTPGWRPDYRECSPYVWAHQLWSEQGRTTFMYGDTFYSDYAVDKIVNAPRGGWHIVARFKDSDVTGKPYPEVWGFGFEGDQHRHVERGILSVCADGLAPRASIYELHKWVLGERAKPFTWEQRDIGAMTHVDDWTEDFDHPRDYDMWAARRRLAGLDA